METPLSELSFPPEKLAKVAELISRYPDGKQKSAILPILHMAQEHFGGWLSPEVMDYVALWIEAKYVQDSPTAKPFTILLCTDKLPYIEGKEIAIELL